MLKLNAKINAYFCLLVGGLAIAAPAKGNELRNRLISDARDGVLNDFSLGQAALIAGRELGTEEFERASNALSKTVAEAIDAAYDNVSEPPCVALFKHLHTTVLTGEYRSGQNDLNRLLERGDYNCVTATILYKEFCRATETETQAIAAPAHVFCRLVGRDAAKAAVSDVETTCPTWFDQSTRRTAPRSGRPIDDVQLIGKIFYNRGVYLLQMERFESALEHLEISLLLDPGDRTAQANRLAAFNNWALAETEAGNFESAVSLLRRGMTIDPIYPPYLANDLHVHQKWVRQLCRKQRESEAVQILRERARFRPDESLYRDGPLAVYRHWLKRLAQAPEWDREIAELAEARRMLSDVAAARREELQVLGGDRARRLVEFARFTAE